jgi:ferredoxin
VPTLEVLPNRLGPAVRVEADGPLVDVCDEAHAPVDFSCRSASCGTCRVAVITGAELLEPPREDEIEVLRIFEAGKDERLACQARARPGPGLVQLRWIDE